MGSVRLNSWRSLGVGLLLAVFAGLAPARASMEECAFVSLYESVRGPDSLSTDLAAWIKRPEVGNQNSALREWIKDFGNLPEPERLKIFENLRARPGLDPTGVRLVGLMANDPTSWSSYVHDLSTEGDPEFIMIRALRSSISSMPEALRAQVSRDCMTSRGGAAKVHKSGQRDNLPGRRALDLLWALVNPPEPVFDQHPGSPIQALDAYFALIHQRMGTQPQYSAAQLIEVARAVQERLKSESPWLSSIGFEPRRQVITLFGSFPMGRANLATSDIDADGGAEGAIESRLERNLASVQQKVGQILASTIPGRAPPVNFASTPENLRAPLSPIQIVITPNSIQVAVYGSQDLSPNNGYPSSYDRPTLYTISTGR